MKIILAEMQPCILYGLKVLLAEQPGYHLMGVAVCSDELFELMDHAPDLILLNMRLPGGTNETIMQRLKQLDPDLPVIVMSSRAEHRSQAIQAGATAFVCQAESVSKLLATLRTMKHPLSG